MEIWINPQCSKCRSAKAALDDAGIEYVERRYLEEPPTTQELIDVLDRLRMEPWEIARTGEQVAKDLGLKDWPRDDSHRDRWIDALIEHPKLIQRPIITASDATTRVARDDESIQAVISAETTS